MKNSAKIKMFCMGLTAGVTIPSIVHGNHGYPLGILILIIISFIITLKTED